MTKLKTYIKKEILKGKKDFDIKLDEEGNPNPNGLSSVRFSIEYPKYKLIVKLGEETYNLKGDDPIEMIMSIKPPRITNSVLVTLKEGRKSVEKKLFVWKARRVFRNRLTCLVFVRSLLWALK